MKKKYKVVNTFKKFKAFVEKKSDHNRKVIRFHRGNEFTSKEFGECCVICWPLTVSYRVILNTTLKTIKSKKKKCLKNFGLKWFYLLNHSPNQSVWNKTLQQVWNRRKLDI